MGKFFINTTLSKSSAELSNIIDDEAIFNIHIINGMMEYPNL